MECRKWIKDNNELIVIVILVVGVYLAYLQLRQNARETKYMYLTGVWNDIMKESIEHPEFNDKSKTLVYTKAFQGDQKRRYESYVRWVGGFIEDLHTNHYKEEKWLYYEPWIEGVLDTHSTWFIDHIHYYEYTDEFYKRLSDMKNKKPDKTLEATGSDAPKPSMKELDHKSKIQRELPTQTEIAYVPGFIHTGKSLLATSMKEKITCKLQFQKS